MNRRGFLGGILAASAAPAFVGSSILMPVRQLIAPALVLWGDGIHDDTDALQAWFHGGKVVAAAGAPMLFIDNGSKRIIESGRFLVSSLINVDGGRTAGSQLHFCNNYVVGGGLSLRGKMLRAA